MTSNLLESKQVYLFTFAVTRYCMLYFGHSSKIGTCFQNKSYLKKSDVENFKNFLIFFLFHELLLYVFSAMKFEISHRL